MLNTNQLNTVTPNTSTSTIVIGAYIKGNYSILQDKMFDVEYNINTITDIASKYNILPDTKLDGIYNLHTYTDIYSIYNIRSASVCVSSYDILASVMCTGSYNIGALCIIDDSYDIHQGIEFDSEYNIRASNILDSIYNLRASSVVEGRYDIRHNVLTKLDSSYNINLTKNLVSQYDLYYIPRPGEDIVPGAKAELDKKDWLQTEHVVDNAITREKIAIEQIDVTVEAGSTEGTATVEAGAMVLGFVPVGNQDQYVDEISINDTTLTVTLAAAATVSNALKITVLNA